ncbi:molybdopterin-dependent oxidoreductase [Oryzibacter oryziterrae]|uniref:molybdopterin-dependent oxidoreductase n=1 Tax=Oryzibacter oryziterrae TaxID=2766474 RepID=UPI001F1C4C36|nr:molybdopterin-dependent oxidoreductase [Oryzibacter oryziterrae]
MLARLALTMMAVALASPALALDPPKGPVILTISGSITETNNGDKAEFDLAMLNEIEQRTTHTKTPWTEGETEFSGPVLKALLDKVGAKGSALTVTALNDFATEIPTSDFTSYPVILASTMNGMPMSVRDKGPLFVIYPFSEYPDIYNEQYFNRSAWQVATIEVHD